MDSIIDTSTNIDTNDNWKDRGNEEFAYVDVPTPPIPEDVPDELKVHSNFVLWRYELRDGELTKVPLTVGNYQASHSNSETWTTFDKATNYAKANRRGIGFVFSEDDPYAGIDLDNCRNPRTGRIQPWAQKIIDGMNSYTEVSPSSTGVKIFVQAALPPRQDGSTGRKRTDYYGGAIEMYDRNRFFTLTGEHLPGTPRTIEDAQDAVQRLIDSVMPADTSKAVAGDSTGLSDDEVLRLLSTAKNSDRFHTLYSGDTSQNGYDESSADLALCNLFAFYTGNDPEQIDRLMRQSGLYRDKWERNDYRNWTITKALADLDEFYTPKNNSRLVGAWNRTGADSPQMGGFGRRSNMAKIIQDGIEPVPEDIPGEILTGKTHAIFGQSGGGKTFYALRVVVRMLKDGKSVLYLDAENGEGMIAERLVLMGVDVKDLDRLHYYQWPNLGTDSERVGFYHAVLEDVQPDLIVFDSFINYLVADGKEENSNTEVEAWCQAVLGHARGLKITSIILDHIPKGGSSQRGAARKRDFADVQWYLKTPRDFDRETVGKITLKREKAREGVLPEEVSFKVGGTPFVFEKEVDASTVDELPQNTRQTYYVLYHTPGRKAFRQDWQKATLDTLKMGKRTFDNHVAVLERDGWVKSTTDKSTRKKVFWIEGAEGAMSTQQVDNDEGAGVCNEGATQNPDQNVHSQGCNEGANLNSDHSILSSQGVQNRTLVDLHPCVDAQDDEDRGYIEEEF